MRDIPFAHRGLHGGEMPENSMAAFLAAVGHGYGIETDVRFTKDKRLILFHDDSLLRMTGDGRQVLDCTYAELSTLPLISDGILRSPCSLRMTESPSLGYSEPSLGHSEPKAKNPTNEVPQAQSEIAHIPLFSDFLEAVGGRVPLLIEIKHMKGVGAKEIARALSEAMKGYRGAYAVQSFDPLYVHAYKKLRPEVPCGLLGTAEAGAAKGIQAFVVKHLPLNFYVKPDFISYRKEDLPRGKLSRFRGLRLAWVVRSEKESARLRPYIDNIIFESFLPH